MKPIVWKGEHADLIDQTVLPHQEVWLSCRTLSEYASAIRDMKIRGAPAIGICAAYGLASVALQSPGAQSLPNLEVAAQVLAATRPTAVNLFWAIDRMMELARRLTDDKRAEALVAEALAIHREDEAMCRAMGDFGAEVVPANARILTHCNAGALATGDYGTALGVVRSAHAQGKVQWVWVDETRPFLQGARLTAWELMQDNVPVKLICDNMAGHFMQREMVDFVVVGADRITANGDVANKIGTYSLAVLCKEHGIPFYVAAPSSTVDFKLSNGLEIPIEERAADELRKLNGTPVAPTDVPVANPGFDMTPNRYITGIITEKGICRAPYQESLAQTLGATVGK
jgi:methylthioribose-1-phosphate isomerase